MRILFFEFRPIVATPNTIKKFNSWWKKELEVNPKAVPTDEFVITDKGPVGGIDRERAFKVFHIVSELKKARKWLKNRL